ncbi:MAG TPA: hypothetical protein VLI05_03155 [Candidatus Saccharimonadia bacterium]|nr:hypothetical protein [Candidatus Saccharimonadia bacterium]
MTSVATMTRLNRLMTEKEAGQVLGVPAQTIAIWASQGYLQYHETSLGRRYQRESVLQLHRELSGFTAKEALAFTQLSRTEFYRWVTAGHIKANSPPFRMQQRFSRTALEAFLALRADLIGLGEAARILQTDRSTIRMAGRQGELATISLGPHGDDRYRRSQIKDIASRLKLLVSSKRLARRFGVNTDTVNGWVRRGWIEPTKTPFRSGNWFSEAAIDTFEPVYRRRMIEIGRPINPAA